MARFNEDLLNGAIKYYEDRMKSTHTTPYNYCDAMRKDIIEAILYGLDRTDDIENAANLDELEEVINDALWTEDMVTGNGSGSYTMDASLARKYVGDNLGYMVEMVKEFDCKDELLEHLIDADFEWIDVSIRCYLLPNAIWGTLDFLDKLGGIEF